MNIKQITKKDGSTVYRANIYLGTDKVTGKKVKTTITARTKKEVKTKAREAIVGFSKDGRTRVKSASVTTYQELAALWWESYQHTVKPNTQRTMKAILNNHVMPLFGRYKLDKLTTPLIQSIINDLANKANSGAAGAFLHYDQIHALNKRILQYGVTMQALPYNPAREVILPRNIAKTKQGEVKHFEKEELRQFLDYLDTLNTGKYRYLYDITLYKFLLATGCRIRETLALHWSDIDLEKSIVHITKTLNYKRETNSPKSPSSYRDIPIDRETVQMLKNYKREQTQEAWKRGRTETVVFSNFIHEYPNKDVLHSRLRTHFKRAKVPDIGFHGFRHTHASLLLNSGIPYKELQHRLGHSHLSMTMDIYSHLSKENTEKAVSYFETALKNL